MALEFCEHEDVVFDDAPLVTVLSQIRFPPVLSLMTLAGVTGFQTALRDEYPVLVSASRQATLEVGPEALGASASAPVWKFADSTENWTVGLAADFVSLETPKYSDIGEFLGRFRRILTVLHKTVRPADSVRVGFRKVNVFAAEGRNTREFTSVLRPELLGPLAVEQFPALIGGFFSNLGFADEDNALMVRYGLAEHQDGEPMKFLLDMDYFTERPTVVDGDDSLIDLLRYFSDGMTSFFHWAVTADHKQTLGPHSRQLRGTND